MGLAKIGMVKWLFGLALLIGLGLNSDAQMRANLEEEINKIIRFDTEINNQNNPGYIIGVVVGDSSFVFPYGTIREDTLLAPNRETLFEVGGMTKVFTAALVHLLVAEEKIHYDSTLNSYLPAAYQNPNCADIRIVDLLYHTSGLPRMPLEFGAKEKEANNPYAHYTKKDLLEFYRDFQPIELPGKYLYSNLAYGLLEIVLERQTNQNFRALLQQKVLRPFGMQQSDLEIEDRNRLAQGHTISGQITSPWTFQSFAASEGLKSNVQDLIYFIQANLNTTAHVEQEPMLQVLQTVQFPTQLTKTSYMAGGWHMIRPRKKVEVLIHPGSTSGFRAFAGFVRNTKTGVVVLSNSEFGTNGLGMLILRMLNNEWRRKRF